MEVGLYAGSFDPVHLGHMALITSAVEKLERVVVVVAMNPQKATAMFSVQVLCPATTADARGGL